MEEIVTCFLAAKFREVTYEVKKNCEIKPETTATFKKAKRFKKIFPKLFPEKKFTGLLCFTVRMVLCPTNSNKKYIFTACRAGSI